MFSILFKLSQSYVIIIDDINLLFSSFKSFYISEISKSLSINLDKLESIDNIFLIFTANESKTMPLDLKERFLNRIFIIKNPTIDDLNNILSYYIYKRYSNLDSSLNIKLSNIDLEMFANHIVGFSIKEVVALLHYAFLYAKYHNNNLFDINVLMVAYNYTKNNKENLSINFSSLSLENIYKDISDNIAKYNNLLKNQNSIIINFQNNFLYIIVSLFIASFCIYIISKYIFYKNLILIDDKLMNLNSNNINLNNIDFNYKKS
jgi:hypothetical protein